MPTVVKVVGGYLEVDMGGTGGGQPPYPSQGPGFPTHPIAPGGQPPGIWGGGNEGFPTHPISPGGQPPGVWPAPGRPSHPIAPGGQPPGVSGGPGSLPPWAMPPIAPGGGGGGGQPHPEHPIPPQIWIGPVLPPGAEEPQPDQIEWHSAWSQETGWITVGVPTGEVPTPSEGEGQQQSS